MEDFKASSYALKSSVFQDTDDYQRPQVLLHKLWALCTVTEQAVQALEI